MPDAHMLYVGTYGPEDPTRATLLFAAAIRMRVQKRVPVKVALLGEGVRLLQDKIAETTQVMGARAPWKWIREMIDEAVAQGVEIHC